MFGFEGWRVERVTLGKVENELTTKGTKNTKFLNLLHPHNHDPDRGPDLPPNSSFLIPNLRPWALSSPLSISAAQKLSFSPFPLDVRCPAHRVFAVYYAINFS